MKNIADALIAAVIGDVKSWEISDADKEQSSINYYCEMREWKDKCKEAEHRAEVVERALKDIAAGQENLTIKVNGKIWSKEEIYKQWIEQAEKELAEERKE